MVEESLLKKTEDISRFLFKGDYDSYLNVKGKAFTPAKNAIAVSVYRIGELEIEGKLASALEESNTWQIADEKIAVRDHKGAVTARTDFKVQHVFDSDSNLIVIEHREDHQRHAHIQPFPILKDGASDEESRQFYKERETLRNKLAKGLIATVRQ